MKKTILMIFAATLLMVTTGCPKKSQTCKTCGWYKEDAQTVLIKSAGQKCDGEIDEFINNGGSSGVTGTAAVKAVQKEVRLCN